MRLVDTKPSANGATTPLVVDAIAVGKPVKPKRSYPPSRTAGLKPPWKKGESGNPAGPPRVGPRVRPALMKYLDWELVKFDALTEDDFKNMTVADALACTMLKRGSLDDQHGDKVREFVAEHVDGGSKPTGGDTFNIDKAVLVRYIEGPQ